MNDKEFNHLTLGNSYPGDSKRKIVYFDDFVKVFSEEEILNENQKELEENSRGISEALKDGLVEIPIGFKDINDYPVEKKAWVHPTFEPSCSEGFFEKHGMLYNIYVPSYGRAGAAPTIDMLKRFGATNWYVAVDPSQYESYRDVYGPERIILRDISFRDPSMVDLGTSVRRPNKMSGTAGIYNNLLSFSKSLGEDKYFTMDDDFIGLAMKAKKGDKNMEPGEVYNKDNYYRCSNVKEEYGFDFHDFMHGIEKVGSSITNHGFLGLEKFGTVFSLCVQWKFGTRVYSFYLTNNDTQPTHVGAMNNDVITSFEQSKWGLPPGLIEVIGYNSMATQAGNGGLSDQYKLLGTLEKGTILVKFVPNYTKIVERYNRIHHNGDYTSYNKQRIVGVPSTREKVLRITRDGIFTE